jgi:hypothetical protein
MTLRMTEEQFAAIGKKAERSKYGNKKADGFDSKKEGRRYAELQLMERAGEISNLRRQIEFSLHVNGEHICVYRADATYERNGRLVVEDVKSPASKTPIYRIKKRLMAAVHGIEIEEV